jgi:DNA-binding PadR family transcriptional regulator
MNQVTVPLKSIIQSMNHTSWVLLELIKNKPALNFYEIRKETNLSQEKCYKELSRLEGGVLITGNRRMTDMRIINYQITEYGLIALNSYLESIDGSVNSLN